MIQKSLFVSLAVPLMAAVLVAACGGGDETSPTPTSNPTGTAAGTSTVAATATAAGTPTPAQSPGVPPTLKISSVSPDPARVGDNVTVTFKTEPSALIGFQITDPTGKVAIQTQVTAGGDGVASFDIVVQGATGKWLVEAAAGRSIADLLLLQIRPTTGPNTADATFDVQ